MAHKAFTLKHALPLAARIGTKTFQLQPSVRIYGKDATHVNLGHIFFDAPARELFINDENIEQVFWNDVCNVVAWVSSTSSVVQGRLSFVNDCREAVGSITYRTGESVIVTACVALEHEEDAPPSYGMSIADSAIGTGLPGFDVKLAAPFAAVAALDPSSENSKIYVTEFKTELRKDSGNWTKGESFEYAIKGGRVYCYVDDNDISHDVVLKHDNVNGTHLVKEKRDLSDPKLNYTFDIILIRPTAENEQTFSGTWEQNGQKWDWKGTFRRASDRDVKPFPDSPQLIGSDGLCVDELLTITSLKQTTRLVKVSVPGADGESHNEERSMTGDMAQEEAERIFANIILHNAPEDIRKVLSPDMPPLSPNEQKIADLGPDYLKMAGVINVMKFLKGAKGVAHDQSERIDENKCDAFVSACAQFQAPLSGDKDYVQVFGWDREKDKEKIEKLQVQYRHVAEACYRLGYRTQVIDFQKFLRNAKEWYGIFAKYLLSSFHLSKVTARAQARDEKIQHDVYEWHNKLVILFDEAGDNGDAPTIADVIAGLQGALSIATMNGIQWNAEFASNIKKFFEDLDEVDKNTKLGRVTTDAMRKEVEEYEQLRELLKERDAGTWAELGKTLVDGIEGHAKLLGTEASIVEVADSIAENKAPPTAWTNLKGKLAFLRRAACSVMTLVGAAILTKTLLGDGQSLGLAEQISMMASLIDATAKTSEIVSKATGWFGRQLASTSLMKGVGEGFRKLLERRALSWINAAKDWVGKIAAKAIPSVVRGFFEKNWATVAKGIGMVFGFFVSMASLVASTFEFIKAWKEGSKWDAVFAAEQLFFAALGTIAFAVEIVASLLDAATVAAMAGTIGIWMAGLGIVAALIALIVQLTREHPDPIKDFISKYGAEYGLLK